MGRNKALFFAADLDGHVLGTLCAVTMTFLILCIYYFALAGRLDSS